ncbi:hypothetical protein [Bacillus sp. NEB1478]|uniref:hypothetical protein n=1 Tax=Bacillus sp. NEB1478 TaxID=3073816 RepID=UPI002873BF94|nr:hypothetical protein [Bacillus sp. NEB1478]WNB93855.1 hypothetical protein RGB74_09380 [Bacillus sp. NEB1478]
MSGTIVRIPIINNNEAHSNINTREKVSFSHPLIDIVNTIAPIKRGFKIPFTRPIKADSVALESG